jgi:hypothetical protein
MFKKKKIMKTNYIQPSVEVTEVQPIYALLSESNPLKDPKPDTGSELMY